MTVLPVVSLWDPDLGLKAAGDLGAGGMEPGGGGAGGPGDVYGRGRHQARRQA